MKSIQDISYKTLFTILFFSLAGIIFFLRIGKPAKKVSAAWWDEMWYYRKAVSVENSDTDITNQYIKITLDTASLISANKMKPNCDDIRVTNINGQLLTHFIDGNSSFTCNTNTTSIYVLVDSIPSSGSTIYIYYGNSLATNNEPTLGTQQNPGLSCKNILEHRTDNQGNKDYYITPSGNLTDRINVYCDMANNGGGWILVWHGLPSEAMVLDNSHESVSLSNNIIFNNMWIKGTNLNFGITSPTTETAQLSKSIPQYYYEVDQTSDALNPRVNFHDLSGNQDVLLSNNYFMYGYGNNWRVFYTCINVSSIDYLYIGGYTPSCAPRPSFISTDVGCVSSNYCNNARSITPKDSGLNLSLYEYQESEVYVKENIILLNTNQSALEPQSEELSPAPISYWKFDEGAGTTAYDSIGNNNGIITGVNYLLEDQCLSGKCLNFNGSGSPNINIPTSTSLNFGNENFTISAWALNRDYTYPKSNFMIKKSNQCFTDGSNNSGFDIGHSYKSNGIDICIRDISNNYVRNTLVFDNGFYPSQLINKWTHYTFIFNRTSGKIIAYINGVKQNNELNISTVTESINSSANLTLGTMYGWQTDGIYDEVKIYSYTRTADQIKQDYNSRGSLSGSGVNLGIQSSTTPSLESSLLAYYKFNEGVGITVFDSSTNKKSGVFFGTTLPTWSKNCKSGNCVNFTSINGNKITTNTIYNNDSEYTISTYIHPSSTGGGQFRIIIGSAMGNNIDSAIVLPPDGSNNICYHNYSGTGDTNYCSTNNPLLINQWQHVSLTFKNNEVNLFHNGINVKNVSIGKTNTNNYVLIGGATTDSYGGARFFDGLIDEVKIYDRALTPEEVKQDYNAGSAIQFGTTNQTIGGTTTSLEYCIPGDTSYCVPPIAQWNFEENSGNIAKDTSGNNNNGTISGATWTLGQNNKGAGLSFSNNQHIISTGVTLDNSFTIESWVYTTDSTNSKTIISKGDGSTTNYCLDIRNNDNSIGFFVYDNSGAARGLTGSTATKLPTNKWTHITGVYNSTVTPNFQVFLNGVAISTTANWSGTLASNISNTTIGSRNGSTFFNGKLDDVKIYNYARTPAQIAYDYNRGSPIGWWKLDECQGSVAHDSSGFNNHGNISIGQSGTQTTLGTCQTGTSAAWTNGSIGKINSSLNFDGTDDYVLIANGPYNNFGTSNFTISSWIKTTHSSIALIVSSATSSLGWRMGINSSRPYYLIGDGTQYKEGSIGSKLINDNKWHLITNVYLHGDKVISYIDGVYNTSVDVSTITGSTSNTQPLGIGSYSSGNDWFFPGQIDDVRIYNYALTEEQIKQVYNNGAINFR